MTARCPPPPPGPLPPQNDAGPLATAARDVTRLGAFLRARQGTPDGDPVALFLLDALAAVSSLGAVTPAAGREAPLTGWEDAFGAWQRVLAVARAEEETELRGAARSHDADPVLVARLRAGSVDDLARRARRAWERTLERERLRAPRTTPSATTTPDTPPTETPE